jgi:hypothetical protein
MSTADYQCQHPPNNFSSFTFESFERRNQRPLGLIEIYDERQQRAERGERRRRKNIRKAPSEERELIKNAD